MLSLFILFAFDVSPDKPLDVPLLAALLFEMSQYMLLPPELLGAIDPVPFGQYAMKEEQGHFTEHGYISLSGDQWQHEQAADRSRRDTEKKPSIRERLEQGKKECAGRQTLPQAKGKSEPEL